MSGGFIVFDLSFFLRLGSLMMVFLGLIHFFFNSRQGRISYMVLFMLIFFNDQYDLDEVEEDDSLIWFIINFSLFV